MNLEDIVFKEKYFEVIESVKKCTCQILYDGKPDAEGSGVMVTDGKWHFLITAAHVVEKKLPNLYVRSGLKKGELDGIIRLEFESDFNKTPDRSKDKIDVAILKLSPTTVSMLGDRYDFLNLTEIGVNHVFNPKEMFVAVGFPATMTKRHFKTGEISSESTFIQMPAAELEVYNKLECNQSTNIILSYPKNKMISFETDLRGTAPDLNGMSGGGLWKIFYDEKMEIKRRLVGILTEWTDKKKFNHVISTRIDVVSEMLRCIHSANVPASQIFRSTFNIESLDNE